jgi:hypothetical protein
MMDLKLPASPTPIPNHHHHQQQQAVTSSCAWVSPEADRSNSKQVASADPSRAGKMASPPSARISNPYQKIQKTDDTTKLGFASPPTETIHPVEENRKRALETEETCTSETKTIHKLEETRICSRCDQPITTLNNENTLCIVWKHKGEVWQDRYTCCGRVEFQPCFIGTHHQPHPETHRYPNKRKSVIDEESQMAVVVRCHCRELAILKRTHKPGPNHGRYFYRCNKCNFFRWADQAHGINRPLEFYHSGQDVQEGIPEAMCLHADPWSEHPSYDQEPVHQHQRLIAACLVKEITIPVMGPPVKLAVLENEVIAHVRTVMQKGPDAIVEHLSPLSRTQIETRFGDLNLLQSYQAVSYQECKDMLQTVLERNRVLQLTVTATQRKDGHRVLHLKWLRNYIFL